MEPFVVKHYIADDRPTLKGNGFDGIAVGTERDDAEEFVGWVNRHLAELEALREQSARLLGVLQMVYRKHCLQDEGIGWQEVSYGLGTELAEAMGDQAFQAWVRRV